MKTYTFEEVLDKTLGEIGTPRRDEFETDIKIFLIGNSIRKVRETKGLTQEQLGELMGVKRSQVCRIEKGQNLSFKTVARAFRAMGVKASLDLGQFGKVALW